jgi:hypothetical protein
MANVSRYARKITLARLVLSGNECTDIINNGLFIAAVVGYDANTK